MNKTYTLTVSCPDKSGLIASITNCIASNGGNILNMAQHTALDISMFFCKVDFDSNDSTTFSEENFRKWSKTFDRIYANYRSNTSATTSCKFYTWVGFTNLWRQSLWKQKFIIKYKASTFCFLFRV